MNIDISSFASGSFAWGLIRELLAFFYKRRSQQIVERRKVIRDEIKGLEVESHNLQKVAADYYGSPPDQELSRRLLHEVGAFGKKWQTVSNQLAACGVDKLDDWKKIELRRAFTIALDVPRNRSWSYGDPQVKRILNAIGEVQAELSDAKVRCI